MPAFRDTTRTSWLAAKLGDRRLRIAGLLSRMRSMSLRPCEDGARPTMLARFMVMLGQVADEREEETRLINRIEDIEAQHRFLRRQRKLNVVTPESAVAARSPMANDNADAPLRPNRALWLLLLWAHMMGKNIDAKPEPGKSRDRFLAMPIWLLMFWGLMTGRKNDSGPHGPAAG